MSKILPSFLTSSHTRLLVQAPASLALCIPQTHKACPPCPGPLHLLPAATRALFFPGLPKAGIFLSFKLSSNTNEGKAIPRRYQQPELHLQLSPPQSLSSPRACCNLFAVFINCSSELISSVFTCLLPAHHHLYKSKSFTRDQGLCNNENSTRYIISDQLILTT